MSTCSSSGCRADQVLVRLTYKVSYGDLDVALFRIVKDDTTGEMKPQRVVADLTAVDNACLEAPSLPTGRVLRCGARDELAGKTVDVFDEQLQHSRLRRAVFRPSRASPKDGGVVSARFPLPLPTNDAEEVRFRR